MKMRDDRGVDVQKPCILALDGGGVRGLSSLLILRDLMEKVAIRLDKDPRTIRPCDYFGLIIGTGTGGISALFLGRLRMSVTQAIEEYIRVAEAAFTPRGTRTTVCQKLGLTEAVLDGAVLDRWIGQIVEQYDELGDHDARLANLPYDPARCQTAVLAVTSDSADAPAFIFRSYKDDISSQSGFTIREVARATAATAGLFHPVTLGTPPIRFIDAGVVGYNNPSEVALLEAETLWPGQEVDCFVSLGTGQQNIISVGTKKAMMARACTRILQNCEQVHARVEVDLEGLQYFRFNVDRGLNSVDIMEWNNHGILTGVTAAYVRWPDVKTRLNTCAKALSDMIGPRIKATVAIIAKDAEEETRKFLPILNPAPEIFYGRHDDVARVVDLIEKTEAARIAILGPPGIGKTSIALAILHHKDMEKKFGKHRRFMPCDHFGSTLLLVDAMCAAFGLQSSSFNRLEDLLLFLHALQQPLLVVLDNFETVWDVKDSQREAEEFLRDLANVRTLSLILTMRGAEKPGVNIRWTEVLDVDPLDLPAASSTFLSVSGLKHEDHSQLHELLQAVGCVALAVILLGGLGQNETASELLDRWRTEQTQLISPPNRHRLDSVDESIGLSIRSNRMQSNHYALSLLSIIAMLPSGIFPGELTGICPHIANVQEASATLVRVALAYREKSGALVVLPPIRAYILKHYYPTAELIEDVQSFYFRQAKDLKERLQAGGLGYQEAVSSLARNEPNFEAVIAQALSKDEDTKPKNRIGHPQAVQAALDWTAARALLVTYPRKTIIELALRFARKNLPSSRLAECLQALGNIQRKTSEYGAAQDTLVEAQELFEARNNQPDATWCLYYLGESQFKAYKYKEAQHSLTQAQRRFQIMENRYGAAVCLRSLGELQSTMSDYETAQKTLTTALEAFTDLEDHDGQEMTECLRALGETQYHIASRLKRQRLAYSYYGVPALGPPLRSMDKLDSQIQRMYANAQNTLNHAREEFETNHNWHGTAWCVYHLGDIYRMTSKLEMAQEFLMGAHSLFEAINDRSGFAACLYSLGDVQRMNRQYEDSRRTLKTAQKLFEAIGDVQKTRRCRRALERIQIKELGQDTPTRQTAGHESLNSSLAY